MSRFRPRSPLRRGTVPSRGITRGIKAPIRSTSICAKRSTKASNRCEERLAIALNDSVSGQSKSTEKNGGGTVSAAGAASFLGVEEDASPSGGLQVSRSQVKWRLYTVS